MRTGVWDAKYKHKAIDDGRRLGTIAHPEFFKPKFDRLKWIPAPPSSHLVAFALDDARELLRRRDEQGRVYVEREADLPMSRVFVRFKAKGNADVTQYGYYCQAHALLEQIYGEMLAAESPGEIVHARLEKDPLIFYRKEAEGY